MNTETIDQRIRSKAQKELKAVLQEAFDNFIKALEIMHDNYKIKIVTVSEKNTTNGAKAYNRVLLNAIKDAAFEKLTPKYEEKAISEFLKKVDTLDEKISDLYSQIEE